MALSSLAMVTVSYANTCPAATEITCTPGKACVSADGQWKSRELLETAAWDKISFASANYNLADGVYINCDYNLTLKGAFYTMVQTSNLAYAYKIVSGTEGPWKPWGSDPKSGQPQGQQCIAGDAATCVWTVKP